MANKKNKILLDVRTPSEFETQHIHGYHNIPLDELPKHAKEISKINKDIVLVCRTGARAKTACKLLKKEGSKNIQVLEGGIVAYDKQGHKLVIGTQKWDIERQVRFAAGLMVLTGIILGYTVSQYFFLLSAFVGLGLIFASITNTCMMGMLLTKLPYNKSSKKTKTKKLIEKLK
ncbi:MAG TPA: DUF2892 domain-containing protein [Candidatus Pacearchaeota archaeon]|nr:DUF2892 domain-containing protein [Candidatus Pacearchaeota archaeon]